MAFYGFTAKPADYSGVAAAGRTFGQMVAGYPEAKAQEEQRAAQKAAMAQLKVDVQGAEKLRRIRILEAADEYKKATGETDDNRAVAFATKYYPPLTGSERKDPAKALERWTAADDKFYPKIEELTGKRETMEATRGVSGVIAGRQGPAAAEGQDDWGTWGGEWDKPGAAPAEQPAGGTPRYRQEAYAEYGKRAAAGEVPYRTAKQLAEDPQIAALQEYDPFREKELELKRNREKRQSIESGLGATKERNKNLRWLRDTGLDLQADANRYNKEASLIQKAIVKMQSGDAMDPEMSLQLKDAGIPLEDLTDVDRMKGHYNRARELVDQAKEEMAAIKKAESNYAKGEGLAPALTGGAKEAQTEKQAKKSADVNTALNYVRQRLSPSLVRNSSIEQITLSLPRGLQNVFEERMKESLQDYSEAEIKQWLLGE